MAPHAAAAAGTAGDAAQKAVIEGTLTVANVAANRTRCALPKGVAAFSDSNMFKSAPSTLKQVALYMGPSVISLGGGLPSQEYFPFHEISVKAPSPRQFADPAPANPECVFSSTKHDVADGTSDFDLEVALNYGQSVGYAALVRWITEHVEIVHNPPYGDWEITMAPGSTQGWDFVLRMLCKPGDMILTEEYTFCSAMEGAAAQGVTPFPVKVDAEGLLATSLDEILTNWDPAAHGSARKPSCSTPSPPARTQRAPRRAPNDAGSLQTLIPSYLSMDTDGRVIRLDSFSKVLSPGSRVSFLVSSAQFTGRMIRQAETSTQAPSGMAQIILYKLLDESWGHEGYLKWLIHIRIEYTKRRNCIMDACEEFLPKAVASCNPPTAGMFQGKDHKAIEEMIFLAAVDAGVLVSRGSWFLADQSATEEDMFFRSTFAAAPADKIREAIRRFGEVLKAQFNIQ
ncbi:amino transferase [Trichophyton equinum CBS 127.97]|uniref:Amino transferase n=1 Tax=Trichophyton equinum (strain ATCC MYA-4606 / CBS 127.97) TaxID=559882 RepID=F2PWR2_TRIEC|nr:amino transferase [Trichophyton equinum CBS 127.97]